MIGTLHLFELERPIKTGFVLFHDSVENEFAESDFQITSIEGSFRPYQSILNIDYSKYDIDFEYSNFLVYTKKLFRFLDSELKMWSD